MALCMLGAVLSLLCRLMSMLGRSPATQRLAGLIMRQNRLKLTVFQSTRHALRLTMYVGTAHRHVLHCYLVHREAAAGPFCTTATTCVANLGLRTREDVFHAKGYIALKHTDTASRRGIYHVICTHSL